MQRSKGGDRQVAKSRNAAEKQREREVSFGEQIRIRIVKGTTVKRERRIVEENGAGWRKSNDSRNRIEASE